MKQTHLTRRLEGRLFAEAGTMFMVLDADDRAGTARVSCRLDGEQQVVEMPLAEAVRRISTASTLILDNMNSPESLRRISRQGDHWYFASREGSIGPYLSKTDAAHNLCRYILAMQTTPPAEMSGAEMSGKGAITVDTLARSSISRRARDQLPQMKIAAR